MAETYQPTIPPKKKRKNRKKWPWIILLILIAALVWFFLSLGSRVAGSYEAETAQRRDIATYYSFSGNLTPITDKIQTAKDTLKVKEVYVKEGEVVVAGQPLLRGVDGTRVLAQESGTIEALYVDPDDQLQAGTQIAQIVDYDTLEITVDVDEYDIGALSTGKQGTVYLNALNRNATGQVSEIARNATTEGGVSYYEVKLEIDATEDIRSGMSVEVNVLNQQVKDAVSISVKALSYDEYNKPYVLVAGAEDSKVIRYVQLGVSDGLYTEIIAGVSDGESVYYTQSDMMRFYMMRQGMGG